MDVLRMKRKLRKNYIKRNCVILFRTSHDVHCRVILWEPYSRWNVSWYFFFVPRWTYGPSEQPVLTEERDVKVSQPATCPDH